MSIKSINNQLPKVTICVPVRNGARTIQRTLDSLLNQDYPNYEIIVSDNCSDDETAKIVRQYASNGVKYFFNPVLKKWGAESNWNHILTLAEGPLIALYHADDLYTPTMVRRQVEFLKKNYKASAVFTMSQIIDEKDRPIRMSNFTLPKEYQGQDIFPFPDLFNAVLKYRTITVVPTMMTRKVLLDKVGNFNWRQFCSAADIDLYLRMAQIGTIGIIDEPLHKYRISPQQGTTLIDKSRTHLAHFFWVMDYWLSQTDMNQFVESSARSMYDMYRASDHVRCAMNMLVLKQPNEAKKMLKKALKVRHLYSAVQRPRKLFVLVFGYLLLWSIYFGAGPLAGQGLYRAHQFYLQWPRKPLNE